MFLKNFAGRVRGHTDNFYDGLRNLGDFDPVLKDALFKGLAVYSPDDLSYLRFGHPLYHNDSADFDSYFVYLSSTYQLMKYRLFASLSVEDRWSESIFQIVLAVANLVYELLKAVQAVLRVLLYAAAAALSLLVLYPPGVVGFGFGVFYPILDCIEQAFRIIPAVCLFMAGIFGVVTRNVLGTEITPMIASQEETKAICANIGGSNYNEVSNRINTLSSDKRFFSGRTNLERIIDKPTSFLGQIDSLFTSRFRLLERDQNTWAFPLDDMGNQFKLIW